MKIYSLKIPKKILSISAVFVLVGCSKERPRTDNYEGDFIGYYMWGDSIIRVDENNIKFELTESNDTALFFDDNYYAYLKKTGKDSLYGSLYGDFSNSYYGPHKIKGQWSKFFGKYTITGTFSAPIFSFTHVFGAFEMKSK